ncbi:hypothetical protein GF314_14485 [bacterium]|nr:hypothetical protein [bacterium]
MAHRRSLVLLFLVGVVAALGAVTGCGGQSGDDQVLATVGDRVVDAEYFKSRLARMEENQLPRDENGQIHDMSTLEGKRAFLDVIIDKELMVLKAMDLGFDQDTQIDAALNSLIEHHAMLFFWKDEIGDPSKFVSEEDVDEYYSRLGERRDCRFVICDFESRAEQAVAEARAGAPWSEIVAKYHDAPNKEAGQEPVINVAWGQYRDEFEEPIFAVEKGGVTEPIPTEHGWWVLRVDDVVMEEKPALEDIKDRVLLSIAKRHENLRREALLERVREEREFMLDEEVLQIVYDGLPDKEEIVDPATGQPVPQDQLEDLDVPTSAYDRVLLSYVVDGMPRELTVADFKATFDRQNVFERPKKGELLGGLRAKLTDNAERSMMVDEARQRGYFEDERVIEAAYRQVEKMLVDKVHSEVVAYEEYVSMEELEALWAEHSGDYMRPERRSGQMVRCSDEATAVEAREAIISGDMTWKAVNRQFGNDPQLVETFGRTSLVRKDATGVLRDVLFRLDEDEISQPFQVDGGWAVVQLSRVVPPETPTLEDMTEAVTQRIRGRRQDAALRKLLDTWAEEYPIEINEDVLATMPSWEEAKAEAVDKQFQI